MRKQGLHESHEQIKKLKENELERVVSQSITYQWFLQEDLVFLSHDASLKFEWGQQVWLWLIIALYL